MWCVTCCRSIFAWIGRPFRAPLFKEDPTYSAEWEWTKNYKPVKETPGEFVLEQAQQRVADSVATENNLNVFGDLLLRSAGTLSTILIAAVGACDLEFGWPVRVAVSCFLSAMVLVLWSRVQLECPVNPRIRDILESVDADENAAKASLAASLHARVEGMKIVNGWRAARLQLARFMLCLGVGSLLPIVFWA